MDGWSGKHKWIAGVDLHELPVIFWIIRAA